jgi:hypothetical protein
MNATTGSPPSTSEADDPPEARDYFWSAWDVFWRDPFLLGLRLGSDFARWVLYGLGVLWIGMLMASQWSALQSTGLPGAEIVVHLTRMLGSPGFIVGATGLMGTIALTGLALDALVTAGIWHTLAEGVRGRPVEWLQTAARGAARGFPSVVLLRLLSGLSQGIVLSTGGMLVLGLVVGFREGFGTDSLVLQVLALSVPLLLYAIFAALVRLTFEVASAPLFLDDCSTGEAIAEAADFAIRHLGQVYRLVVFALGLLLIPLFGYWFVLLLQNVATGSAGAMVFLGLLRVVAELALAVSTAWIGILFYGALFVYYARSTGRIESLPRRWEGWDVGSGRLATWFGADDTDARTRGASNAPDDHDASSEASAYEGDETLYDLLPLMHDHVASLRSIPGLELDDDDDRADSNETSDDTSTRDRSSD